MACRSESGVRITTDSLIECFALVVICLCVRNVGGVVVFTVGVVLVIVDHLIDCNAGNLVVVVSNGKVDFDIDVDIDDAVESTAIRTPTLTLMVSRTNSPLTHPMPIRSKFVRSISLLRLPCHSVNFMTTLCRMKYCAVKLSKTPHSFLFDPKNEID